MLMHGFIGWSPALVTLANAAGGLERSPLRTGTHFFDVGLRTVIVLNNGSNLVDIVALNRL
jgi:hypothetical protein